MTTASIDQLKAALRQSVFERRDALPPAERQAAAETIAARPFPLPFGSGAIVSGFSPIRSEINPLPLLRRLEAAGAKLALPVIDGKGKPLIMRAYKFGDPLEARIWGIREPKDDAPEVWPDILIVPLAAFDRRGNRLGHGAGYYDMTIHRLRAHKSIIAVGIAYAVQEAIEVPVTERDETLDLVLTERNVFDFRKT